MGNLKHLSQALVSQALGMMAVLASGIALAQPESDKCVPKAEQPGQPLSFAATPPEMVNGMLDLAKVTSQDYVTDLGSGDGRIVIAAAKRGARAFGVEIDACLVAVSRRNAEAAGVAHLAEFAHGDMFKTDLSKFTVIAMWLVTRLNVQLRPLLLELKPGTRVVSSLASMGGWEPEETNRDFVTAECSWCRIYLWLVPAKVAGRWTVEDEKNTFVLNFVQEYQMLKGTAQIGKQSVPIVGGRLRGADISFSLSPKGGQKRNFQGRVVSDTIEPSGGAAWRMRRIGDPPPPKKGR